MPNNTIEGLGFEATPIDAVSRPNTPEKLTVSPESQQLIAIGDILQRLRQAKQAAENPEAA